MSKTKLIFATVAALLVGLAGGFTLSGTEAKSSVISWKYGDAELKIDLEKDLADDETLLGKIFSREYSAAGAASWLKNKHGLYAYNDPDLAGKLVDLDYDDPAARELRDLRERRVGPWAYRSQDVKVGIPIREDQPFTGHANVCEAGIFYRQQIELFLPDRPDRKIILKATGRYSCPEGYGFPDIQLSREDARKLFGYDNFSKYERAAAVVVQE